MHFCSLSLYHVPIYKGNKGNLSSFSVGYKWHCQRQPPQHFRSIQPTATRSTLHCTIDMDWPGQTAGRPSLARFWILRLPKQRWPFPFRRHRQYVANAKKLFISGDVDWRTPSIRLTAYALKIIKFRIILQLNQFVAKRRRKKNIQGENKFYLIMDGLIRTAATLKPGGKGGNFYLFEFFLDFWEK